MKIMVPCSSTYEVLIRLFVGIWKLWCMFVSIWKWIRNAHKDTLTMKKLFAKLLYGAMHIWFFKVFWPSHLPISNIVYIIPIYSAENSFFIKALFMFETAQIDYAILLHESASTLSFSGNVFLEVLKA